MKYRKKPIVIEAIRYIGENIEQVTKFVGSENLAFSTKGGGVLDILTKEGRIEASIGDFIIKGVKGEFYPCKPDIFAMSYDKVEE